MRRSFTPSLETFESRLSLSLVAPVMATTPISGAVNASTGIASVSSSLAAHAVAVQSPVNQYYLNTNASPNPMDPIESSVPENSTMPNPLDPAAGSILRFHVTRF